MLLPSDDSLTASLLVNASVSAAAGAANFPLKSAKILSQLVVVTGGKKEGSDTAQTELVHTLMKFWRIVCFFHCYSNKKQCTVMELVYTEAAAAAAVLSMLLHSH